jgi:hypothetical protein
MPQASRTADLVWLAALSCRVTEFRRWVAGKPAPHHDVGLLILDRFPRPQDTLAAETAALGDLLRALIAQMSDELNPHYPMVAKSPLSDETERLHRDTAAPDPAIKPVERLGPACGEVELNANLASAFVGRRHCHREPGQTAGPPLESALDPLPGLIFSHRLRHHREPGYVRIPVHGLGNSGRITDPERAQSDLSSGQRRIGRREITHWESVADIKNILPDLEGRSSSGVLPMPGRPATRSEGAAETVADAREPRYDLRVRIYRTS